jgi:hypothetical protein
MAFFNTLLLAQQADCSPHLTLSGFSNTKDEGLSFFGDEQKGWASVGADGVGDGVTSVVFDG